MEKNKHTTIMQPTSAQEPQLHIRRSWILSIFLIIPAVAIFGAWDTYFNSKQLLPYLRFDSLFLPLYLLIFELPHVLASFFGFFQKEYIRHYQRHLFLGLPLMLTGFVLVLGINFYTAFLIYLVATLYHVIRQQAGIAHFFGVPKNHWHWWWTWFLIIGLAGVYIIMQPSFVPEVFQTPLLVLVQGTLVLATVTTLKLILETKNSLGVLYVLATLLMAFVSYWMLVSGYEFLSVLVVRVIHDVTAFLFYITHEVNSNYQSVKNYLYRFVPFMPWSLVFVVPATAVLLGLFMRSVITDPLQLFGIVMVVSLAHYYLESIIWKRDGLHREQIRFT
jgi:hypothetical protein